MIHALPLPSVSSGPAAEGASCEHRTVSKDGRIVCTKISEGDNTATVSICRSCPFLAVDCAHLRFSLRRTSPSPLVVRFNGRTEIWDDEPAQLRFQQAACACQVIPVHQPSACSGCPMRQPVTGQRLTSATRRAAVHPGKVVPFPRPEPMAAAG